MNKKEFKKQYGEARKSLREAAKVGVNEIAEWRKCHTENPAYDVAYAGNYYSSTWHNIHFKGRHSPRIAMQCNLASRARNLSPSRNGFGPSSEQFCYCGVKP